MVFLFMECKTRNERLQEVCINFGLMVVNKSLAILNLGGPGSAVGIATGYGLDGPGDRIPVGARFSAPVQSGLVYRVFLGCKERPGRDADPSPPSSAAVKKE